MGEAADVPAGKRRASSEHRTVVDVAPERIGVPYEDGKRLTDTFQYRGWVGETLATAGEARASASVHRADKIREEALRG